MTGHLIRVSGQGVSRVYVIQSSSIGVLSILPRKGFGC